MLEGQLVLRVNYSLHVSKRGFERCSNLTCGPKLPKLKFSIGIILLILILLARQPATLATRS